MNSHSGARMRKRYSIVFNVLKPNSGHCLVQLMIATSDCQRLRIACDGEVANLPITLSNQSCGHKLSTQCGHEIV